MMSSPNASSWLPWIWAIEYLASNHTNPSVLIDLVKKIPDEVLENDKNVKELVSLRILESLCVSRKGNCGDGGFDLSGCCENVLGQVLVKESSGQDSEVSELEMVRRGVEAFVKSKRACLPKCGLEQLKDVILKDNGLVPSVLKERSGLLIKKCSDGVTQRPTGESSCDGSENLKVKDYLSVKRVGDGSGTANQGVASACKQMIVYNAYPNVDAGTKRKRDAFCTQQVVDGNDLASIRENRHVDDFPGKKHSSELRTLGSLGQAVAQKTKSFDAIKDKCEPSCSLVSPNSLGCGRVNSTMENDHERDIVSRVDTYHDENNDSFGRENTISNAQYSDSQDSSAKLNGKKPELCMICKIGGQLLICSSGSCRRVVHERCLGTALTFDAKRRFYCPFCAYSRAAAEYSDSKKQYSLARKALLSFINQDKNQLRNANVLGRKDPSDSREFEVSDKCIEENNLENSASRVNHAPSMIHMKENPSGSFDLSSRERERVVIARENIVDKQNAGRSGRSACCQSIREQVQQVSELDVHNCKAYNSFRGGSKELAVVEKLQEVIQKPNGVILLRNNEEQKIASQAVNDSEVHNYNCKDMNIACGSEPLTRTGREQNVSDQLLVMPCEPAKPMSSDVEGTSGEKDDKSIARHSFRFGKQEQHYPYPSVPQLRRKKVPWSNAEEEALKEGVRRFASSHDRNMPWKKILEFGAEIFEKHRTTIDLKDKWRNICKGTPKV